MTGTTSGTSAAVRALPPSITDHARSRPWFGKLAVNGQRFSELLERQPRFRIDGVGKLSQRTITPETAAARTLWNGKQGQAVQQALRGLLATFDSFSDETDIDGIAFSDSKVGMALNGLLGGLSGLSGAELAAGLPEHATKAERREAVGAVELLADMFGPYSGYSPRYLTVSPQTSQAIVDLAADGVLDQPVPPAARYYDGMHAEAAAHVAVHELAHRVSGPDLKVLAELQEANPASPFAVKPKAAAELSRLQFLSEGLADLVTGLPGVRSGASKAMGFATNDAVPFYDGYEGFVTSWKRVFSLAGLNADSPADTETIRELADRPELSSVPDALAPLIVQRHGLPWSRVHEVASKINHIGATGILADSLEEVAKRDELMAERTADLEHWVSERSAPLAAG